MDYIICAFHKPPHWKYNCNDYKEGACALARNLSSEGSSFIFKWQDYSFKIELTVAGEHNIINAMAASVVAV